MAYTLKILVGIYLIYNGGSVLLNIFRGNANATPVLIIVPILFIGVGAWYIVRQLKMMKAENKDDGSDTDDTDDEIKF